MIPLSSPISSPAVTNKSLFQPNSKRSGNLQLDIPRDCFNLNCFSPKSPKSPNFFDEVFKIITPENIANNSPAYTQHPFTEALQKALLYLHGNPETNGSKAGLDKIVLPNPDSGTYQRAYRYDKPQGSMGSLAPSVTEREKKMIQTQLMPILRFSTLSEYPPISIVSECNPLTYGEVSGQHQQQYFIETAYTQRLLEHLKGIELPANQGPLLLPEEMNKPMKLILTHNYNNYYTTQAPERLNFYS